MKKTFLYFCLLFIVQTAFAADSLYVREQQIPILIDRRQCQPVGHPSDTSIL